MHKLLGPFLPLKWAEVRAPQLGDGCAAIEQYLLLLQRTAALHMTAKGISCCFYASDLYW
jgi:hypothetical protein